MAEPRPQQQEVLGYEGGTMGVAAVPGSGKTWTLTRLAARLVAEADLDAHQEVLVVTLVNSSVDNFSSRIDQLIEQEGMLPDVGYRVCTLHTLAHEIVRARPDLAGLSEDFHVIDDRQSSDILRDVASSWYQSNQSSITGYLTGDISDYKRKEVLADKLPGQVRRVAQNAITYAKSNGLSPEALRGYLRDSGAEMPLAEMAQSIYQGYQQALNVRNAVDYDDLIRHALQVLRIDDELLTRLRDQWPFVLEDEAQDSSKIQQQILRRLVGDRENWVRVGDPNQAIYESFTTADPNLLREFVNEADQSPKLAQSGRSQPSIIKLANRTIWWSQERHPNEEVQGALTKPFIRTTSERDPQPNPPDRPDRIAFVDGQFTEEEEIKKVASALGPWLEANPKKTCAMLVPVRGMGVDAASRLEEQGIPYTDSLLKTTSQTREAAQRIERVVEYLAKPTSPARLARCYVQWRSSQVEANGARDESFSKDESFSEGGGKPEGESKSEGKGEPEGKSKMEAVKAEIRETSRLVSQIGRPEEYIWPQGRSWLSEVEAGLTNEQLSRLEAFREKVRYWLELSGLPIGQLIMALGRDFFSDPDRLALVQKFSGLLRRASNYNPEWGLPRLSDELEVIAENERRFEGVGSGEADFDPEDHKGEVTISTMHGAKGLEWDRVHMMGVNDYHFPAAVAEDSFLPEKWYYRDGLNLQAETLAQIDALMDGKSYEESEATTEARHEYARERIRLFYVCVTRAREELMITTNIGRFEDNRPALIFEEMRKIYDEHIAE
ncbi:ATP-dependent helicase [Salinibacter ruber]|uniref:DNA 3'-5' helicase n=1 Tax=Salinibacter ruber TaxID=146919 RepID=A0A9X2UBP8_9BACT|nr:ATP-dependent helicase [Salinibacter ruber]MCS3953365.1 DNA helicase-2/ATP-dependent DNA helicase PcrA [Salinibacter ruber]MCS4054086.1 DNA helicase-2/ATP-dependent DNA helicase PcrA [Salinibacter ruber]MCS4184662.1 DNA helicase-2/ATP-dependent DNA helicase PcrA [Salinibacter ruber]